MTEPTKIQVDSLEIRSDRIRIELSLPFRMGAYIGFVLGVLVTMIVFGAFR